MYLTCWVCNNFDICPNNMGLIMCFLLSFFLHHITDRWLSSLCKLQYFSFMHASNVVSKARIKIYLFFLGTFPLCYPSLEIEDPHFWSPKPETKAMEL